MIFVAGSGHVIQDGGGSHSTGVPGQCHSYGSRKCMPGSAALANKRSVTDGTQSRKRDGGGTAAGQLTAMSVTGHQVGPTQIYSV